MALLNLRNKIESKFNEENYSESDVLYLIIEIRKYLERSAKDLGDPAEIKLNEGDYPTIKFFRNWVAHPEKHDTDISKNILDQLKMISANNNEEIEKKIFNFLVEEITKFINEINPSNRYINSINWDSFLYNLKGILVEQPIKISSSSKYVGYDNYLRLKEITI